MRSITVDSDNAAFLKLLDNGVCKRVPSYLDNLIKKLKTVKGITGVNRFDSGY